MPFSQMSAMLFRRIYNLFRKYLLNIIPLGKIVALLFFIGNRILYFCASNIKRYAIQ